METAHLSNTPGEEPALPPQTPKESTEGSAKRRLSGVLRLAGAAILIAAGAAFLVQGFSGWDSVQRIGAFLVFTLSLTGAGVICGIRLRDPRGARVAVGLAALMIPALMSQLGGVIYSLFHLPPTGPDFLIYRATSAVETMGVTVLVLLCAIPIVLFAFSILARSHALTFTTLYLGLNILLLLPERSSGIVATLVLVVAAVLLMLDLARFAPRAELQTTEARFTRIIMFLPVLNILCRSIYLYGAGDFEIAAAYGLAGAIAFFALPPGLPSPQLRNVAQGLGTLGFMLTWQHLTAAVLERTYPTYGSASLGGACFQGGVSVLPATYSAVAIFPVAIILATLSMMSLASGRTYRSVGAVVAIYGTLVTTFGSRGGFTLASTIIAIVTGLMLLTIGVVKEERLPFIAGVGAVGLALLCHLSLAARLYSMNPWLTLSVLGLATLVSSSLVERNFEEIARRARSVKLLVSRLR